MNEKGHDDHPGQNHDGQTQSLIAAAARKKRIESILITCLRGDLQAQLVSAWG